MSEVRKLWIEGPAGRIEAMLRVACPVRATALVAHPHPQFGGTMHNPVVFHADRALHRAGLTTLRFNFRGVGTSDGSFDQGRGEVGDLAAAASFLRGLAPNVPEILIGYSFGSWCALRHAAGDPGIAGLVAIGLPVRIYDVASVAGRFRRPLAVVQGSDDEFGSPDDVRRVLEAADPPGSLEVVDGAPHLFPGRAGEAAAAVHRAVEAMLDRVTSS